MKLVSFWQKDKYNFSPYNLLMIIVALIENYFIAHVCICKSTFKNKWVSERFLAVLFKLCPGVLLALS